MWRSVRLPDGSGVLLRGEELPGAYRVCAWESGGHREISVKPVIQWTEEDSLTPEELAAQNDGKSRKQLEHEEAERRERNQRKAAQRAKTRCRRFIKTEAFNQLLTITYRENQTDVELFKKHFKEWVRRMRAALGGQFRYCSGFEPQQRGAWHAHVTCHRLPEHVQHKGVKVPAWRLGTVIWRSIVGQDNGLVFVGGKTKTGLPRRQRMSCAQMAAYVSKYIIKHYELMPDESNRYSRSDGGVEGERYTYVLQDCANLTEAVDRALEWLTNTANVVSHRLDTAWGGRYWLVTEEQPPGPG